MANGLANGSSGAGAKPLSERIVVIYYSEKRLSDGTIVMTPLRKMVPGEDVTAVEAAALADKDVRTIQRLCDEGYFKTARKSGPKPQSHWVIARSEVLEKKANGF